MSRENEIKKSKSFGRPKLDNVPVTIRLPRAQIEKIDAWRAEDRPIPSRSVVIGRFVERCLRTEGQ
jgi:hypothetical protein